MLIKGLYKRTAYSVLRGSRISSPLFYLLPYFKQIYNYVNSLYDPSDAAFFLVQLFGFFYLLFFSFFKYLARTAYIFQKHSRISLRSIFQLVKTFQCLLVLCFSWRHPYWIFNFYAAKWAACHLGVEHSGHLE